MSGLLDDLLVGFIGQDKLGSGGGRGKGEPPLPRLDIPDAVHELGNELTTWARVLVEDNGWDIPDPAPRRPRNGPQGPVLRPTSPELDLIAYAALFLAVHAEDLRRHPAAAEAHRGITEAIERAAGRTDRRPPLAYLGPCPTCGVELRAAPGAAIVACGGRDCDKSFDGAALRARLLRQAEDEIVTAAELSAALTALSGTAVAVGTIHSWRSRAKLAPRGWLHDGHLVMDRPHLREGAVDRCCRPLYRVGDAASLLDSLRRS